MDFDDETFDVVTCFQVLHHVNLSELNRTISELYRVLKKGGILIIREHDCIDDNVRLLIDIEHTLYETVTNGKSKMNGVQLCDYKDGGNYNTIKNWVKLIETGRDIELIEDKNIQSYYLKGETRYTNRFFRKLR